VTVPMVSSIVANYITVSECAKLSNYG